MVVEVGLVTVVMAMQTLRWDGIILLSLVDARIKTFMLLLNLMERIAYQITIGKPFTKNHIQLIMR